MKKKKRGRNLLPRNKKGAEMTIGTIIVIILALVVLVVLIYGLVTGWGNLWQKITGIGGGKVNVQSVVQSCQLACTGGSKYDWCQKKREVIVDGADGKPINLGKKTETTDKKYSCDELKSKNIGLDDCSAIGSCTVEKNGRDSGSSPSSDTNPADNADEEG